MPLLDWLTLMLICLLGALTPGPSLAVVLRHTLTSRAHGVVVSIFHALGVGVWALFTVFGLAVLIAEQPQLFKLMTLLGALYLAWLGWQALRRRDDQQALFEAQEQVSLQQAAADGFLMALLNPKLAIFFIALFAQFVSQQQDLWVRIMMAIIATTIDAGWYLLVALLIARTPLLGFLQSNGLWVSRLMGGIFIFLALQVVLELAW